MLDRDPCADIRAFYNGLEGAQMGSDELTVSSPARHPLGGVRVAFSLIDTAYAEFSQHIQ